MIFTYLLGLTATACLAQSSGQRSEVLTAPATNSQPKIVMNSRDGLNYVWIPPGTYMMGGSAGDQFSRPSELPAHQVTITHGFWMGQTLVTQAAYKKVMGTNPSKFVGDQLPVDSVTWEDAKIYSEKVGMRLPTEAEWEYAARAGTATARYAPIAQIAWYKENSGGSTHEVGLKVANNFGLYDMMGDVVEWVNDWWANSYPSEPAQDPQGPSTGEFHVLRGGGGWWSCPEDMRVSARFSGDYPPNQDVDGFRCVAEVIPDSAPATPIKVTIPQPYSVSATWKVDSDNVLSKVETEASWGKVKSDESWHSLVVDPVTKHLYIARDTKIEIVDTATGKLIGTINGLKDSQSIALDNTVTYGFISDSSAHKIVVFNRKNFARVTDIDVGNDVPDSMLFEPATHTLWSFDDNGKNAAVIDIDKFQIIQTISLPGKPQSAVSNEKGTIFVSIKDKNEIARIDARTRSVMAEWPLPGSPSGIAIDLNGHRLISSSSSHGDRSVVLDAESGKILATLKVGEGADGAIFNASRNLAYIATEDGFLSVVDFNSSKYPVIEKLITYPGARNITYHAADDRIYTVSADTQMISPPVRGEESSPDMGGPDQMGGPDRMDGGPDQGGGGAGQMNGGPDNRTDDEPQFRMTEPQERMGASSSQPDNQEFSGGPENISNPRSHGPSKRIVIPGTFVVFVIARNGV